jgi:hypothetical protein
MAKPLQYRLVAIVRPGSMRVEREVLEHLCCRPADRALLRLKRQGGVVARREVASRSRSGRRCRVRMTETTSSTRARSRVAAQGNDIYLLLEVCHCHKIV